MIEKNSKEEIIQRLLVTKQRAHLLQVRLLLKGKQDDAKKVESRSKLLTKQIDNLLGQVMEEWQGRTENVITDIITANAALQTSITNIKKNVETAQNIVKAIGLVDDVIGIAKGLILV